MLLSELEYTQQVSELIHPILNKETSPKFINWMPNTWITDYKKVLVELEGEVKIHDCWVPTLQRKYNVSIMDYLSQYINDRDTLKILNNCRLYLQIFTLSEITSIDGKKYQMFHSWIP